MKNVKKVLVLGKGFVASLMEKNVPKDFQIKVTNADILNVNLLQDEIKSFRPDIIINTAAKTNIDWCEKNKDETFRVNVLGADNVATICAKEKLFLVHFSSGCLQESLNENDVKSEEDSKSPLCFYTWTKAWAEDLINDRQKREGLKALIIRPRLLMSSELSNRNSIMKLLTYTRFIDIRQSATIAEDMLSSMWTLIRQGATGPFNMANPGLISPLDIAHIMKNEGGIDLNVTEITPEELNGFTHVRRIRTVLSVKKLQDQGIELQDVKEGVKSIARALRTNLQSSEGKEVMARTHADTKAKLQSQLRTGAEL